MKKYQEENFLVYHETFQTFQTDIWAANAIAILYFTSQSRIYHFNFLTRIPIVIRQKYKQKISQFLQVWNSFDIIESSAMTGMILTTTW